MGILIEFKPSLPTEKMWEFAQEIARTLAIDLPEKEYEAVSSFLEMNSEAYYDSLNAPKLDYDVWKYSFWMPQPNVPEDDD